MTLAIRRRRAFGIPFWHGQEPLLASGAAFFTGRDRRT